MEKYRLNTFHCKVDYNTSKWKLDKSMGWGEVNNSIYSQNTRQPLKVINVYLGKCSQFTFARKKKANCKPMISFGVCVRGALCESIQDTNQRFTSDYL